VEGAVDGRDASPAVRHDGDHRDLAAIAEVHRPASTLK